MDFDQTWYILKRIWNPIDFQGQGVKFLGEGIRHALRCPSFNNNSKFSLMKCYYLNFTRFRFNYCQETSRKKETHIWLHDLHTQGGQHTSYIQVCFYQKLYNGGNFSTIWQSKTHFYTILTTNLYDKSQHKKNTRMYDIRCPPWIQNQKEMLLEWLDKWQQFFLIISM